MIGSSPRPLRIFGAALVLLPLALGGCGDGVNTADGGTSTSDTGPADVVEAGPDTGGASDAVADGAPSTDTMRSEDSAGERDADPDGGRPMDGKSADATDTTDTGDAASQADPTRIALPADGDEILYSVAARVEAPEEAERVTISVVGQSDVACDATDRTFECLLDVSSLSTGEFTLRAVSVDGSDEELGRDEITLERRPIPDPCDGRDGDRIDCVLARTDDGESAGFSGVSYLNFDDAHAKVRTNRMEGIDARVLESRKWMVPSGVDLGIANESRACVRDGTASIPRCFGRTPTGLYKNNVFAFWPEHRDHGKRDFYQWKTSSYAMSQGSSGSEKDEVKKLLTALGMMSSNARSTLEQADAVAPALSMLVRRSRVASDAAYLTREAHVTALQNKENGDRLMRLAAALRAGELPPVAKVSSTSSNFPNDWSMRPALSGPYALGWAPTMAVDSDATSGTFDVEIDLASSADPAGNQLLFFPALLRGESSEVTIERVNPEGTKWRIEGPFPTDREIQTGGHKRTVSRITVGFFPHNGTWLGAPAKVSVGGQPSKKRAPNSNNLD